jgi:hypothetical protein
MNEILELPAGVSVPYHMITHWQIPLEPNNRTIVISIHVDGQAEPIVLPVTAEQALMVKQKLYNWFNGLPEPEDRVQRVNAQHTTATVLKAIREKGAAFRPQAVENVPVPIFTMTREYYESIAAERDAAEKDRDHFKEESDENYRRFEKAQNQANEALEKIQEWKWALAEAYGYSDPPNNGAVCQSSMSDIVERACKKIINLRERLKKKGS